MLSRKHLAYSLLTLAAVIAAILLSLPLVMNSDAMKARLQARIEQQTNGQVHYQQAEFAFLPRPSITLEQVKFDFPQQAQGSIASVQTYPELWPLLTGQLRLARLVLDSPDIALNLPEAKPSDESQASSLSPVELERHLEQDLEPLTRLAPGLTLFIENGSLTLNKAKQLLSSVKGLTLKLNLDMAKHDSGEAVLKGSISALTLHQKGQKILLEGLALNGNLQRTQDKLSLTLDKLSLTRPTLQIKGGLLVSLTSPAFSLDLQGKSIDVDATRNAALAMAGDTTPVKEIFKYLRGGKVPQLSFHSQGESASALGDLKNIVIKGQLQTGAVSIPEIKLDLTEVNGEVVVREGVLEGSNMSTRLEGSSAHNGQLKVALAEDNDLFQLELMLSADLAHVQRILKRVVEKSAFSQLVDKVTNLKGTSTGKLILGDSLADIKARVDISDLNLTADFQGLPFPIGITRGQLDFAKKQIELKGMNGTFGSSDFTGLACNINWTDALHLDLNAGKFGLVLDELYPWVASFDTTKESLKDFKQITGRLDLASLSLKGAVDTIENWQLAGSGTLSGLAIQTSRFPAKIELAKGDFTLDAEKLALQKLEMAGLDTNLTLSGALKGLPQGLDQVEISLDGKMGKDTVAWLRDTLNPPEQQKPPEKTRDYTPRTPLSFSGMKVLWQPGSPTSFKGEISIEKGPSLTLDVDYLPKQLQVKGLHVSDQHSDAEAAFIQGQDEFTLHFSGNLDHRTLEALFLDQLFGSGQLKGDFDVRGALSKQTVPVAKGHLEGKGFVIPLPSGGNVEIAKIALDAEGSQLKADATDISWNDFTWNPVKATIDFDQDKINVNISKSELCGIDSFGSLSVAGKDLSLDLTLEGKGLNLETSYSCLTEGRVKMTGTLDFSSKIKAQGQGKELLNNLQGPLEMNFTGGVIEQSKLLARTLEVLNITEIVKGKLPDLSTDGFAYSSITMQGDFQGSKLFFSKIQMDGDTLDVLGQGELDFGQDTIDLELLASPFKTVDTLVKNIPGINYLMAGSLVAIPVSIKGDFTDPRVRIMSVTSVGSSLLGLGERIIKSPFKLIETVIPGSSDAKK